MYLTAEAIDAVFTFVASLPKSSEIVFTFAEQRRHNQPYPMAEKAAAMGEPWLTYFTVEGLQEKLQTHGFSSIFFLAPDEAKRRYFSGRTDGLEPTNKVSIAHAVV
jgi:O-methyltransferase involved in polyketide biosynthesis